MEIQFKLSIKEFKDIFFYEQLHSDGSIKYKRKMYSFVNVWIICVVICTCFLSSFKEFSGSVITLIMFTVVCALILLFLFFMKKFLFNFIRLVKSQVYWNKAKQRINFPSTNISVYIDNDHIIFYENEDKQYKVSLKNIEIPHIDKTKIYLKIEGRTLYYIPLNAFTSEEQKKEFINIIKSK